MDKQEIRGAIMAILFVAGEAVEASVFCKVLGIVPDMLETAVQEIMEDIQKNEEGIELIRVGNKLQLGTNKRYANYIKEVFEPADRVSLSASILETLSIVAYKQPVTRAEIDDIRGVRSNYAVSVLLEKGLIRKAGRKDVLGRPTLLATTDEFLRHFGIASLNELPEIDFEELEEEQLAILEEDEEIL